MIEKICPRSYRHYTSLPIFGSIIDEFTMWFHKRGYSVSSIVRPLRDTVWIDHSLHGQGVQRLDDITNEALDNACCNYQQQRSHIRSTVGQIKGFLQETRGIAFPLSLPMTLARVELNRFEEYLQDIRGLA